MAHDQITSQYVFDVLDDLLRSSNDKFITYKDILFHLTGEQVDKVKYHKHFNKLIYARKKIERILESKGMQLVYANGKDCQYGFKYPPEAKNPMREERSHSKKLRVKQIERLLRASANLLPSVWLADILNKPKFQLANTEPTILFGENMRLNRIELLPTFYSAAENHKVLTFNYKPGFTQEAVTLIFHTYRIKEYNQRWFVFGQSQSTTGSGRNKKYNICALDRIEGDVKEYKTDFLFAEKEKYGADYFKDIIGVSRTGKNVVHITIECQDKETAERINTKPLHSSQSHMERKEKPSFTIDVIPNKELFTQLLSYGTGIKIISPESVVKEMKKRIEGMSLLYED